MTQKYNPISRQRSMSHLENKTLNSRSLVRSHPVLGHHKLRSARRDRTIPSLVRPFRISILFEEGGRLYKWIDLRYF